MTTPATLPTAGPRLVRATDGRVLGGVGRGLADHLGLSPVVVRTAFVLLAPWGGMGVLLYAAFWVVLPQAHGRSVRTDRRGLGQLVLLLLVTAVVLVVAGALGIAPSGGSVLPLAAAGGGVLLVWQQADASQRARWRDTATGARAAALRLGTGAVLLVAGLAGFLASRGQLGVARRGLLSTVVVVVGLALLSSPWWFAMATDLRAERRERIRSQERAEVAAHLHDSVLQTLALIQKAATEPAEVARLARGQERELRTWLYRARGGSGRSLEEALEAVGAEVEQDHGLPVEVVVVGDCPTDERLTALVAATREAVVNAARHSGASVVQVFAEVEERQVSVFVRDRGHGFDPSAVGPDRHGLSGSVQGRMARHGGTARVRSSPGQGTEVHLVLPWRQHA